MKVIRIYKVNNTAVGYHFNTLISVKNEMASIIHISTILIAVNCIHIHKLCTQNIKFCFIKVSTL